MPRPPDHGDINQYRSLLAIAGGGNAVGSGAEHEVHTVGRIVTFTQPGYEFSG
ncbi:MAG: hypothetical protein GKR94_08345 [Gammaproteobacteria bacterium]|nr:hypothetical protein [Gammaproteobacteria bacterium]